MERIAIGSASLESEDGGWRSREKCCRTNSGWRMVMRVAILNPVRTGGSGGFVKHLTEVVPRLLRSRSVEHVTLFTPEGAISGVEATGASVTTVTSGDYRSGFRAMGRALARGRYDVALCLAARPVPANGVPTVTMVQNIEPIQEAIYGMPLMWRLRLWALRREHAAACRQATRVLAVSGHTKAEVCRRFGVSPDRVDVVHHGIDPLETAPLRKPDIETPNGFFFCAGSIVPYRGYEDAFRALAWLRKTDREVPSLVVAGCGVAYAKSYARSLRRLASALGVTNNIVWAGHLSPAQMRWCYRNARLFIQSSRAEACPNIQLEVIASGCPCVSCDHPPMPEISQDAALYYPVGDSEALARRIVEILEMGPEDDVRVRARARQRAAAFSWDTTAQKTLDVLRKAMRTRSSQPSDEEYVALR